MDAKEIVSGFVDAINREDFTAARQYASDDLSFVGVLGTRNGAETYFEDMQRIRLKFDIKKQFVDGDDVCLLYDVTMAGVSVYGCGWYHVSDGKIRSIRVVFDPRPVIEAAGRKQKAS